MLKVIPSNSRIYTKKYVKKHVIDKTGGETGVGYLGDCYGYSGSATFCGSHLARHVFRYIF